MSEVHGLCLASHAGQQRVHPGAVVFVKELLDRGPVLRRGQVGRRGLTPAVPNRLLSRLHMRRHPILRLVPIAIPHLDMTDEPEKSGNGKRRRSRGTRRKHLILKVRCHAHA